MKRRRLQRDSKKKEERKKTCFECNFYEFFIRDSDRRGDIAQPLQPNSPRELFILLKMYKQQPNADGTFNSVKKSLSNRCRYPNSIVLVCSSIHRRTVEVASLAVTRTVLNLPSSFNVRIKIQVRSRALRAKWGRWLEERKRNTLPSRIPLKSQNEALSLAALASEA